MKHVSLVLFILCFSIIGAAQINQADGDPVFLTEGTILPTSPDFRTEVLTADAGDAIEGDFFAQPSYTPDGSLLLLPQRNTNNISVFDALSHEILYTLEVCDQPVDMAVTADYVIVPCFSTGMAKVYQLSDLTEVASFETAEDPCKVVLSADQSLALVATQSGEALLIDLVNLESLAIPDFSCSLGKFSFITSNTRNTLSWTEYGIAPDNSYLLNASGSDGLRIYDAQTGALLNTLSEVPSSPLIQLSGDGSTWILMSLGTDALISRVDAATATLIDQIPMTGYSVWSTYGGPAVNMDGTRALIPIYPNDLALVRFDQGDFIPVPIGTTPNWLGQSADYQYGVVGSYYLSIVDMATGSVSSQLTGRPIQNGCVSPASNKLTGFDPLRQEAIHFYDFANPNALEYLDTRYAGSGLEADATYSVQFISGNKALAMNPLSGTMTVFDFQTQELLALIPMGSYETYFAAVTEDGKYAVVPRRLENDVLIVDLETYQIVAELSSGGEKPDQAYILPGSQFAYVLNAGGTDRIGVIALDGPNSTYVSNFNTGNTGVSWASYGLRSELVFTPDGQYGVLAASFDDQVQIIDLESHSIVAELDIEGFPLQLAVGEIPGLGTAVGVTLRNTNQIAVLTNVGPDAAITEGFDLGSTPNTIAYGLADDGSGQYGFYVGCSGDQAVHFFSLDQFEVTYIKEYGPDFTPLKIVVSPESGPFTLVSSASGGPLPFLEFGEVQLEFSGTARPDIALQSPVPSVAMVPDIHNDRVLVFFTDIVGSQVKTVSLLASQKYQVYPQPSSGIFRFMLHETPDNLNGSGWIRVYDLQGKLVLQKILPNLAEFQIDLHDHPANSYFYQIGTGHGIQAGGKLQLTH
ncbi:MAG: T9SS type A sorting domain-containing protein [Saprospiraceae bacterium]|nr:T9SS type A sorting domain-containing protein [Saprospiraceae bacterium]